MTYDTVSCEIGLADLFPITARSWAGVRVPSDARRFRALSLGRGPRTLLADG